jgi:hypothetical protein
MGICNFAPNKREKFIYSPRSNMLDLTFALGVRDSSVESPNIMLVI